ncbi:MAG: branched-chain amino acid ABC transporter permease [Candidatus Hodarchaeales archaeon]
MNSENLKEERVYTKLKFFKNSLPNNRVKRIITIIMLILIVAFSINWLYLQITSDLISFLRSISFSIVYGLSFSMLLFIFVSGFFLIFGLADVINFAHGALFMLGGFVAYEVYLISESFLLSITFMSSNYFIMSITCFIITIILTSLILGLLGASMEYLTIRKLYGNPIGQILLTTGYLFIILKLSEIIWGPVINIYRFKSGSKINYFFLPESEALNLGLGFSFSLYRILIILIGLILAFILFRIFTRTKIGLIIQAGIEDSEMVQALGINTNRVFLLVFAAGVALAGLAGAIAVPDLGASFSNGTDFLLYAFVIVVIGGAHFGKLEGTFAASLIVGLSYTFCTYFFPGFESVIVFLIMVFILIFKPTGLTGEA